jgi:hypothetical protein
MTDSVFATVWDAMATLFAELVEGSADEAAWILNPQDPGLLRVLDRLTAADASTQHATGSSIASHVDHLRYGLHLLNQWSGGQDPFTTTDYAASWRRGTVTDEEWREIRHQLRDEAAQWNQSLRRPRALTGPELTGMLASIAHLAYHLGAIRQMAPASRGPQAPD